MLFSLRTQRKAQSELYKCAMVAQHCYIMQLSQLSSGICSMAETMMNYEIHWGEVSLVEAETTINYEAH